MFLRFWYLFYVSIIFYPLSICELLAWLAVFLSDGYCFSALSSQWGWTGNKRFATISCSSRIVCDRQQFSNQVCSVPSRSRVQGLTHKEYKFLSFRAATVLAREWARTSKNIIHFCYHFPVTFFLIQCLISYCKHLTVSQSSEKLGLTVFACQLFLQGDGNFELQSRLMRGFHKCDYQVFWKYVWIRFDWLFLR